MPNPTEIQDFQQSLGMRDNDKTSFDFLRILMSRGGFSPKLRNYTAATTIDTKSFMHSADTSGGAFNLTLVRANYFGADHTPFFLITKTTGIGAFNLVPSGADTINGAGGPFAVAVGAFYLLFSNGNNAWYARAI